MGLRGAYGAAAGAEPFGALLGGGAVFGAHGAEVAGALAVPPHHPHVEHAAESFLRRTNSRRILCGAATASAPFVVVVYSGCHGLALRSEFAAAPACWALVVAPRVEGVKVSSGVDNSLTTGPSLIQRGEEPSWEGLVTPHNRSTAPKHHQLDKRRNKL